MRNVFFFIASGFLTILGLFSDLTFAANVTTGEATNVTSNSATLNGIVFNSRSPSEWFEYGTASGSYNNSTRTTSVFPFAGTATVSIDICGLLAETTYYYRIAAYENTPGGPSFYPDAYGEEKSFTTLAEITPTPTVTPTQSPGLPPTVETGEAEVYGKSAILNGTVNANELPTTAWFEYGTVSAAYTDITSKQTICGSSNISVSIRTGKLPSSFFYRITAQNDAGTTYGNEKFYTSATPTATATSIPVPTPTATLGKPEQLKIFPSKLNLGIKQSKEVIVTVIDVNGVLIVSAKVNAKISRTDRKYISIIPTSKATDENGEAKFVITARNKVGNARVTFTVDSLRKSIIVKVRR